MASEAEYYAWVERMRIPKDVVLDKSNLKLLLSKNLVFKEIMNRVRSKQEVTFIRNQLKVHHHERLKHNNGSIPPQLKLYNEIKSVEAKSAKLKENIERRDIKFQEKYSKVKENGIILIQTQARLDQERARKVLLELKLKDLNEKLKEEEKKREDLLKAFPPGSYKKNERTFDHNSISNILSECFRELNNFYSRPENETVCEGAQNQIWQTMKNLIDPVPRSNLWRALMSSQESIISDIKKMIENLISKQDTLRPQSKSEEIKVSLDYAVTFLNGKTLLCKLNSKAALKPKTDIMMNENNEILVTFAGMIDDHLSADESQIEDRHQLIEQFVLTIARSLILDAEIKFINQTMDELQEEHQKLQQEINYQGTKVMIEATHQLYGELESLVQNLELEVAKIYQIKNKLDVERKFNEDFVRNKFKMNTTVMGNSNNVTATFHSGKTMIKQAPTQYIAELKLFEQLKLDKIKYEGSTLQKMFGNHPVVLAFNLAPSLLSVLPKVSITIEELKDYLKNQMDFKNELETLKKPLDIGFELEKIPETELNTAMVKNQEAITEYFDKISFLLEVTGKNINTCNELFKFMKENPLKKFVPSGSLFNGRPYSDYDKEFSMYNHLRLNGKKGDVMSHRHLQTTPFDSTSHNSHCLISCLSQKAYCETREVHPYLQHPFAWILSSVQLFLQTVVVSLHLSISFVSFGLSEPLIFGFGLEFH
uniref:CSON012277 protein n=1 Tax=Culicoides sonorensis TaxID=179676 RepID=A0A336LQZ8_CULSO